SEPHAESQQRDRHARASERRVAIETARRTKTKHERGIEAHAPHTRKAPGNKPAEHRRGGCGMPPAYARRASRPEVVGRVFASSPAHELAAHCSPRLT